MTPGCLNVSFTGIYLKRLSKEPVTSLSGELASDPRGQMSLGRRTRTCAIGNAVDHSILHFLQRLMASESQQVFRRSAMSCSEASDALGIVCYLCARWLQFIYGLRVHHAVNTVQSNMVTPKLIVTYI